MAENKNNIIILVIILSVSAALAQTYYYFTFNKPDLQIYEKLLATHTENFNFPREIYVEHKRLIGNIVRGKGNETLENRYRILAPHLCEVISNILKTSSYFRYGDEHRNRAFLASYKIYYFLAISFLLICLFYWLKIWFTSEQALIGVLFVAGTITIPFRDHYYAPWSLLEAGLFTASVIAIYKKRYWLLAFIIVCTTLNRETGAFIPLTFFFANLNEIRSLKMRNWFNSKPILLTCGFGMLWAVIYFGLIYYIGGSTPKGAVSIPIVNDWAQTGDLRVTFTRLGLYTTFNNTTLFLGAYWIFAILGFKHAPGFVRRVSLIIPFYILAFYIGAPWWEVRVLMTLYPILIALGLSFIYQAQLKSSNS